MSPTANDAAFIAIDTAAARRAVTGSAQRRISASAATTAISMTGARTANDHAVSPTVFAHHATGCVTRLAPAAASAARRHATAPPHRASSRMPTVTSIARVRSSAWSWLTRWTGRPSREGATSRRVPSDTQPRNCPHGLVTDGGTAAALPTGMRLLVLASLLVAVPAAAAPPTDAPHAREDIVDARNGHMPARHTALGWTTDGAIAVRATLPMADAATGLQAALTLARAGAPSTRTVLAEVVCDDDPCVVAYPTARDFIRAERRALAALPPLTPASELADHGFTVRIVAGDHGKRRPYGQRLELVSAHRTPVIVTDAWTDPDADPDRIEAAHIAAVYAGPDGRLAVVVAWTLGFGCWSAPQLTTVVLTAAP
jgi:hypothetical protein